MIKTQLNHIKHWLHHETLKVFLSASLSLVLTTVFAIYHAILGILLASLWHGSIAIFYGLLVLVRASIVLGERRIRPLDDDQKTIKRIKIYADSSKALLLIDLGLIIPIALMVKLEVPVNMGMIPAISMAAYTTYKIIMALVNVKRNRSTNVLIHELRMINLIDALVSILSLQNTLIMVNSSGDDLQRMVDLSIITGAIFYVIIVGLTIRLVVKAKKLSRSIQAVE